MKQLTALNTTMDEEEPSEVQGRQTFNFIRYAPRFKGRWGGGCGATHLQSQHLRGWDRRIRSHLQSHLLLQSKLEASLSHPAWGTAAWGIQPVSGETHFSSSSLWSLQPVLHGLAIHNGGQERCFLGLVHLNNVSLWGSNLLKQKGIQEIWMSACLFIHIANTAIWVSMSRRQFALPLPMQHLVEKHLKPEHVLNKLSLWKHTFCFISHPPQTMPLSLPKTIYSNWWYTFGVEGDTAFLKQPWNTQKCMHQ